MGRLHVDDVVVVSNGRPDIVVGRLDQPDEKLIRISQGSHDVWVLVGAANDLIAAIQRAVALRVVAE